jgi:transcriptional regulator with PAS, ATPase and Fis domain
MILFMHERKVSVILLDGKSRILDIRSEDGKDFGDYITDHFRIEATGTDGRYLEGKTGGYPEHLYLSPLYNYENGGLKYRFVLASEVLAEKELEHLATVLARSLTGLMEDRDKECRDYDTLMTYLDSVNEGISACDQDGVVTFINKAGCDMIGGTKEEILNKRVKALIDDPILVKVVSDRKAYMDVEYCIEYKNRPINLMNSAYPVYNRESRLVGAVDIFRRMKRSIKVATDLGGYEAIYQFDNFIGDSRALKEAIELSKKFANSNKNILITGESGTGKELFAQAIHNHGSRRKGPFVAINCASYPNDLFDSELFGYEEGAFTGSKKGGKMGKFELANGGTLFLDEIGEMPIHLQAKLLRVIETKTISRIGSNKKVMTDVSIIAATNRNLEEMVEKNYFRGDLYYRLKVLYLQLEPLRNREGDAVLLSNHYIEKFSNTMGKNIIGLDKEAESFIHTYNWPGNIRELENIIALSLFYCAGTQVTKEDLVKAGMKGLASDEDSNHGIPMKLSTVTRETILKTLEKNKGNKKKTAEELGISRNTIYRLSK